jgi:uroporphyrin-III C-methyltransferase
MSSELLLPEFRPGSVWLVGAGPGDPGLLTLLARHALEEADIVLHDALVPAAILALAGAAASLLMVGKRAGRSSPRQMEINEKLIRLARSGRKVVRLKGGDPWIFGRGGEEALALTAAGVPFRVVPGITAGSGVATYASVPLTHRLMARSVVFVTGQETGQDGEPIDWAGLARSADTLVVYMGRRALPKIAAALIEAGRPLQEPVLLVGDGTTPDAIRIRSTLGACVLHAEAVPADAALLVVIGSTVLLGDLLAGHQETAPARTLAALAAGTRA